MEIIVTTCLINEFQIVKYLGVDGMPYLNGIQENMVGGCELDLTG
jgi:hypothetical protein